LDRIKETGDIFFGESDRNWILDGASVHVSMIGFDIGTEATKTLDGDLVANITTQLSTGADLSKSRKLTANCGLGFIGVAQKAPFDVDDKRAQSC
jgi:hypothetical protein